MRFFCEIQIIEATIHVLIDGFKSLVVLQIGFKSLSATINALSVSFKSLPLTGG